MMMGLTLAKPREDMPRLLQSESGDKFPFLILSSFPSEHQMLFGSEF